MFRSDLRHVTPAGPTELPPYYAQRLQVAEPPSVRSARYEAAEGSEDAQAERLFRDFKLGLMTLVIVSLLLLAYFWDGGSDVARTGGQAHEDVLSFSLTAERRGDVLPLAAEALDAAPAVRRTSARRPSSSTSETARPRTQAYVYTVRSGDTLSAIALRFYGDASLWQAILKANSRRLRRPSDLRVGMRLIVPVKVRTTSATEFTEDTEAERHGKRRGRRGRYPL